MQITCPHCWQTINIEEVPYSTETVELVLDCEVCCRPIVVNASWDTEDDDPWIEVQPES